MHYLYRCTTDKLAEGLDRIVESGDLIQQVVHTGGRDWVIVTRRGEPPLNLAESYPQAVAR